MTEIKPETLPETANIVCESCGAEFVCAAKSGKCWCFELEIQREILAKLQKQFRRCLCPQCLNKLSSI